MYESGPKIHRGNVDRLAALEPFWLFQRPGSKLKATVLLPSGPLAFRNDPPEEMRLRESVISLKPLLKNQPFTDIVVTTSLYCFILLCTLLFDFTNVLSSFFLCLRLFLSYRLFFNISSIVLFYQGFKCD